MNGDLRALRAVVADDHPVFRDGLAMILRERGIEVVAEVADGQEALEAAAAHHPDVVLMDLTMPGLGGIEATRRLATGHPAVAVLVLTMSEDDDLLFAALRAGARGYLLKDAAADDIARAVVTVARGETVLGARVSNRVLDAVRGGMLLGAPVPFPRLTEREREVLELVARGYQNARVAHHLGLSEKTVRNHVSAILAKLPASARSSSLIRSRPSSRETNRSEDEPDGSHDAPEIRETSEGQPDERDEDSKHTHRTDPAHDQALPQRQPCDPGSSDDYAPPGEVRGRVIEHEK
jgi:DNA-binding NarL/FixJ family response regulator